MRVRKRKGDDIVYMGLCRWGCVDGVREKERQKWNSVGKGWCGFSERTGNHETS